MAFPHDSLFLNDNKVDLDTYPKKKAINKVLAPEWNALVRGINAIANEAFVNGMPLTNLAPGVATSGQAIVFNGVEWVPGDVTPSTSVSGIDFILHGLHTCTVYNTSVSETSKIMISWLGDHGATRSWVDGRAAGSFTVNISSDVPGLIDIYFVWEIL